MEEEERDQAEEPRVLAEEFGFNRFAAWYSIG